MHACVSWMNAQGLAAALESLLSLGSPVLHWFALGWQWFALFSHLSTHSSQQFSVSFASTHASSTGSRGCACNSSLHTLHMHFSNNAHSTDSGLCKHSAGMLTMEELLCPAAVSFHSCR